MHDIAVIGLGLIGAALAGTLRNAGHDLIVWNRSAEKMTAFSDAGVPCAKDLSKAVKDSRIVLICIDNYDTTRAILDTPDIRPMLRGKIIVQLSSGTPSEAAEAADWMHDLGAMYLDGAILAGPSHIGTDQAIILLSGDADAQSDAMAILQCLGEGTVRYLGPRVGAASGLDLAWLMASYGNFIAGVQAAMICQSEGIGVDDFIALVPDNPSLQYYTQTIHDETFDDFSASLQVWGAALQKIRRQGSDAGINTEFPTSSGRSSSGRSRRVMAKRTSCR